MENNFAQVLWHIFMGLINKYPYNKKDICIPLGVNHGIYVPYTVKCSYNAAQFIMMREQWQKLNQIWQS